MKAGGTDCERNYRGKEVGTLCIQSVTDIEVLTTRPSACLLVGQGNTQWVFNAGNAGDIFYE
jgi:hypothetical protein